MEAPKDASIHPSPFAYRRKNGTPLDEIAGAGKQAEEDCCEEKYHEQNRDDRESIDKLQSMRGTPGIPGAKASRGSFAQSAAI